MQVPCGRVVNDGRERGLFKLVKPYLEQNPSIKLGQHTNFKSLLIRAEPNIMLDIDRTKYIFEVVYQVGIITNISGFIKTYKSGSYQHVLLVEFSEVYSETHNAIALRENLKVFGYNDSCLCVMNGIENELLSFRIFYDKDIDRLIKGKQNSYNKQKQEQQMYQVHNLEQTSYPTANAISNSNEITRDISETLTQEDYNKFKEQIINDMRSNYEEFEKITEKDISYLMEKNKQLEEELNKSIKRENDLEERLKNFEERVNWHFKMLFNKCKEQDWRVEDIQKTMNDNARIYSHSSSHSKKH